MCHVTRAGGERNVDDSLVRGQFHQTDSAPSDASTARHPHPYSHMTARVLVPPSHTYPRHPPSSQPASLHCTCLAVIHMYVFAYVLELVKVCVSVYV